MFFIVQRLSYRRVVPKVALCEQHTLTEIQTADEGSLRRLSELLQSSKPPIPHHLWIEQPENVPTCIALAPNRRENRIKKALDKSGARLWKS